MTVYTACQQTPSPSLSSPMSSFSLAPSLSYTKIGVSEAVCMYVCTHVHTHSHPQRSSDGHWLESVFVILILCFFTSPSQGPSPLLSLLLLLQSGRLGGMRKSENKGAPKGEKSQESEAEK